MLPPFENAMTLQSICKIDSKIARVSKVFPEVDEWNLNNFVLRYTKISDSFRAWYYEVTLKPIFHDKTKDNNLFLHILVGINGHVPKIEKKGK